MRLRDTLLAFSTLALTTVGASAQSAPTKHLGQPTATHPAEFTRIEGLRELSDGRVYLVDRNEMRVVRIDFRSGAVEEIGRKGRGPGEYTAPWSLVALPGDSAALVDMSGLPMNVLLTREGVSPDGITVEGGRPGRPAISMRSATDAAGRVYYDEAIIRTVDGKQIAVDTNAIVRITRATGRRDTVAYVATFDRSPLVTEERKKMVMGGGVISQPFASPIPFLSVDQFAVAPDGRVAVVSVFPYRVTFFDANGRRTDAPPIRYTPVRVDDALKEAYRERMQRPNLGISVTRGGDVAASLMTPRYREPARWPSELPPFVGNALSFASDGTLWVERAIHPDSPPTFDLIDGTGRVTARVELPKERRLVGFGNGTVYLVRVDEDGLEYVERYALPR